MKRGDRHFVSKEGENMDREYTKSRLICRRYVIDDGWNVPQEVIDDVELKVEESWRSAFLRVKKLQRAHKGEWITLADAWRYRCFAKPFLAFYDGQYIATVRELGEEMIERYGITELEAINILNGYHLEDYADKYYKIKHLIPDGFSAQRICDGVLAEYGYPVNFV